MNTFDINLGNVNIVITGNSASEIVDTLRLNNLEHLVHNYFYFSKSADQRTGEGWLLIENMHNDFIVNAFVARLSETIRGFNKDISLMDVDAAEDTKSSLNYLLLDISNNIRDCGLTDRYGNASVLEGLIGELIRREKENSGFDTEPEDMVSSDIDSDDLPELEPETEPYYVRLSGTRSRLSFLDQA